MDKETIKKATQILYDLRLKLTPVERDRVGGKIDREIRQLRSLNPNGDTEKQLEMVRKSVSASGATTIEEICEDTLMHESIVKRHLRTLGIKLNGSERSKIVES